ncbi:MAG: hypothetical protein HY787_03700 [Deltaproteobacteria bacterium]|nr:hypothetical protein [Deltaproteobacteria bacterium]
MLWKQAAIVRFENEKVIPLGPIMTDSDLTILQPWFQDISSFMGQTVMERLDDYQALARTLAEKTFSSKQASDNILTILICALTLDSWVFSLLRRYLFGTYPPRDFAGTFFFWGYAFAQGPRRIFGFTTYNGLEEGQLHMIRSHRLDRRAIKETLRQRSTWDYLDFLIFNQDKNGNFLSKLNERDDILKKTAPALQKVGLLTWDDPPRLAVPFFDQDLSGTISGLCRKTAGRITDYFISKREEIDFLRKKCSFAECSPPDVLCLLFHLAYSYATDHLVEKGAIPDFPKSAGGEWGVWIS